MKRIKRDFRSTVETLGGLKGVGSKGHNSTFSEHGQVAYQIKGNHESSSMIPNILLADPYPPPTPWPWGLGQKFKFNFFITWSCCISH